MGTCIIPTCHYILDNGRFCQCAAKRGKSFCRHHLDAGLRQRKMARARLRRYLVWLPPMLAATTLRDGSNCLQIALETGDLDFPTANILMTALRMRDAIQGRRASLWQPPGTPKSFRLYQVPASSLFLRNCPQNVGQVVENTVRESEN